MRSASSIWEDTKDWLALIFAGGYVLALLVFYPMVALVWLYNVPDANGDGAFTISDFSAGAWRAFSVAGELLADALGDGFWQFFEISRSSPDGVAFWLACFAAWTLAGAAAIVIGIVFNWLE